MLALQIGTIGASFMAAIFWFVSASVRLPATGTEPWKGTGPFHAALIKQSRWNAAAASARRSRSFAKQVRLGFQTEALPRGRKHDSTQQIEADGFPAGDSALTDCSVV
jgi:hypothetical protein